MPEQPSAPLSYRDAGVDIDRGNALVERLRPLAASTRRPGVAGGIGGFGALFRLADAGYRDPVLVSATDGVGTKLKLAWQLDRHDTVGIDLVAMSVNDVLVCGAEPLVFLDYFATGRLEVDVAERVIAGVAEGCRQAGAALAGGETAEMPDFYAPGEYDLAGFCFGAVEADALIDGRRVAPGDVLVGIASSGPHANGYSLIRKVLARGETPLDLPLAGRTLGDALIEPTRIYVPSVLPLMREGLVHAAAHITGGGIVENLPRVLPAQVQAVVETGSWPRPAVFDWLQQAGGIEPAEMLRTFNCGIGMVLVVAAAEADRLVARLTAGGDTAWRIGHIEPRGDGSALRLA